MTSAPNRWIADALRAEAKGHPEYYGGQALLRAAEIIAGLRKPIASSEELKGIKGISAGTLRRVGELLASGVHTYREVKAITEPPPELVQVYGIGPATALKLAADGITTRAELKRAYAAGDISLTAYQIVGLQYYEELKLRLPRQEVEDVGNLILDTLAEVDPEAVGAIVGSFRRGATSSGDVDILFTHPEGVNLLAELVAALNDKGIIAYTFSHGEVKYQGLYLEELGEPQEDGENKTQRFPAGTIVHRKFDLRYVPPEAWVPALIHATGSDMFNVWLRRHANDQGWTLSEHALSDLETGQPGGPFATEAELFAELGLDEIPPEVRSIPAGLSTEQQATVWDSYVRR